jgi:hypothetical protein
VGAQGRVSVARPAFYATRRAGGWRDWWTLLHPPYTAWHLSYVVIGATLAPRTDGGRLAATLVAFFFAVGVSAHALDELHGRPLRTSIASAWLAVLGAGGLVVACGLGAAGVATVGPGLLVFVAVGPLLVLAYNLELFGGWIHTDVGFAAAWGAFPVLVGYYVQAGRLDATAIAAAGAALGLSLAQRSLSTPARALRRRVASVDAALTTTDGRVRHLDLPQLLAPLERALAVLSWSMVLLAVALVLDLVR